MTQCSYALHDQADALLCVRSSAFMACFCVDMCTLALFFFCAPGYGPGAGAMFFFFSFSQVTFFSVCELGTPNEHGTARWALPAWHEPTWSLQRSSGGRSTQSVSCATFTTALTASLGTASSVA